MHLREGRGGVRRAESESHVPPRGGPTLGSRDAPRSVGPAPTGRHFRVRDPAWSGHHVRGPAGSPLRTKLRGAPHGPNTAGRPTRQYPRARQRPNPSRTAIPAKVSGPRRASAHVYGSGGSRRARRATRGTPSGHPGTSRRRPLVSSTVSPPSPLWSTSSRCSSRRRGSGHCSRARPRLLDGTAHHGSRPWNVRGAHHPSVPSSSARSPTGTPRSGRAYRDIGSRETRVLRACGLRTTDQRQVSLPCPDRAAAS